MHIDDNVLLSITLNPVSSKREEDGNPPVWVLNRTILEESLCLLDLYHVSHVLDFIMVFILTYFDLVIEAITSHRFIEEINVVFHCCEVFDALLNFNALCVKLCQTLDFVLFDLEGRVEYRC